MIEKGTRGIMNELVELLVNFINTKIEQSLHDFKKEISELPGKGQGVSPEELERMLDVLKQNGEADKGYLVEAMARLGGIEEEWANISDQVSLIASFLKICGDFCDYNGFFIFKGGGASCYDATLHKVFPQKGMTVAVERFNEPMTLADSPLPDEIKDQFSGISDVYVLPLTLKFKPAGFVLTVLSESGLLDFMKTVVSLMSRELTLMPYKAKALLGRSTAETEKIPSVQSKSSTGSRASISSIGMESPLERAIRYAKLLASEIKLYNEKAVNRGLQEGGIRKLLSVDIERSYNSFRERFPNSEEIPDRIFDEALIQYVADGNADLL
ncbi:MAG: hypothetical protein DRJ08_01950 [Acidobacteria bacterium]|nr:MAG: hypothetical protein DRJ08_01950 [Acidobacteriota bacterium]